MLRRVNRVFEIVETGRVLIRDVIPSRSFGLVAAML
jgi:hypothetical protein